MSHNKKPNTAIIWAVIGTYAHPLFIYSDRRLNEKSAYHNQMYTVCEVSDCNNERMNSMVVR